MSGFDLPDTFLSNPDKLVGNKKAFITSSYATSPADKPSTPAPTVLFAMAKTLCDYSTPVVANVPVGPAVNVGNGNFEIRTGLISMVQASQFCGLPSEDANAHLQHFLELCDTIVIKDVAQDSITLRLFPFSLMGKAKQWFY